MMAGLRRLRFCALAACLASGTGAPAAREPDTARAAELFLRICSACHGEKGNGQSLASGALKSAPRDFTTEEARTSLTREYMIAIVRDGRPHTAMVGRTTRLTQQEIEGVVDFIRAAFIPPEAGTTLAQGRMLYRSACASCHGDRGQGRRARGANPPAPPLSAAGARHGLTAERMHEAIVREPHAKALAGANAGLTADGAEAVVAYVRSAFIEAAPGVRDAAARKAE